MDDEAREEWLNTQASDFADRLGKEFGTKLSNNTDLAARAFAMYFGRKLPDLFKDLAHHVPEDEPEGEYEF